MLKKEISTHTKQFILILADLIWLPLALWLAIVLRWGEQHYTVDIRDIIVYIVSTFSSVIVFLRLGIYRAVIRFMGNEAIIAVLKGISISALIIGTMVFLTRAEGIPRSIPFIYWGIALFFVGGSRFSVWLYYQSILKKKSEKVAIYGAGDAGRQLLTALKQGSDYQVAVFIDDNRNIKGRVINGVKVFRPHHLKNLIAQDGITQILLAMPSVPAYQKRKIITNLESLPVHVKTIPILADIVNGKAKIEELRDVAIEDLLGRDSVAPDNQLFEQCIKNKVVLVSGAGGSIGSELCRQIIKHEPQHLILFELSEFALYSIEQELQKLIDHDIQLTALLGSVQDQKRLQSIFTAYGVNTVYHAAAYKHVPIVEENIVEGIRNNIFGTRRAAEAAFASDVETFVLISTDKAVRPTNIMGTTKRFAEMVLQALAKQGEAQGTRFCMVRFGNVLGSSGSVVPLFNKQIKQGGPVTVTHADIVRYFMTIPEAAQLVLQAGSLGQGGDVFVLDMGESVRISDLAKKMIHLSGCDVKDESNPEGDIEIVYTGLRPGEKLYEELLIGDNVTGTQHPRIMRAEEKMLPMTTINEKMVLLDEACNDFNVSWVREILLESETGYVPDNTQPADLLWCELKKKENNVVNGQW
ncbi:MAG: polysaccharide biosynthesis protein [gamma proteobacterium symbiont of Bathyaustriella thionipta]|nr:polysaccharide biosynthesis protein [gamma proteobacterium symbiont of Bathyaustriella thionipta]MCU7949343.1 polysaccharide biosynthesis protein [gamma proteobacterium symbiont of Bathyaustriella thionipta]MCU7952655.1 polysaccharide biosynthesis protein [gamma proteobacterium symbiont of Bathyaustriella thionipta]MCU7955532.1 polysaccharide biosynthesis protein [gamma proteobacterium symbiont of Bathyaustriella thionipta]MCU7968584.1 polysaccharide biosynthesis protein [gamma proteobacteri